MRRFVVWAVMAAGCANGGGDDGGALVPDVGTGETGGAGGEQPDAAPGCVPECAPGATQCASGGLQTCEIGEGCAAWGSPTACPEGQTCQQGACAPSGDCTSECAEGSAECQGDAVRTCVAIAEGCFGWAAAVPCEAGETCSAGACAAGCQSECTEGVVTCAADGLQGCGEHDADPCLDLLPVEPCPAGESCSNGACAPLAECQDECDLGSQTCEGGAFKSCQHLDEDPCAEWSAPIPCGEGLTCSAGQCVAECEDECMPGLVRCAADGNGVTACGQFDADACLDWGPAEPCPSGETCSLGACAADCQDECPADSLRCGQGGPERCGDFDADPCLEWSVAAPCEPDETCEGGACLPAEQCRHECAGASRQCAEGGVQTCGDFDDDPCADWSLPAACPEGETCAAGRCELECAHECAVGTVRCGPQGGVQRCGQFDADACADWSAAVPCEVGESCSNGVCAPGCADECVLGAARCGDGGVQRCGQHDDDDCTEWGLGAACPEGTVCGLGACLETCQDECAEGSRRCRGEAVETCGELDGDECLEWSAAAPCAEGELCSGGQCVAMCLPECAPGAVRCTPDGLQACAEAAGCPRWGAELGGRFQAGAAAPCPEGTTCSAGECAVACTDECDAGAARCGVGGREICGQFDADACREWSEAIACPAGEACSDGRCAADCTDECDDGAARCAAEQPGSARQVCGQHDADPCREWGPESPCETDRCDDGACVECVPAAEVPDGLDNDCDGTVDEAAPGAVPGWCVLQHPPRLVTTEGFATLTTYGQVFAAGMTEAPGPHPGVRMQVGFGQRGTFPAVDWTWMEQAFHNVQAGNNDEYMATITALDRGTFDYAWRASIDGGLNWVYCDRDGNVDGAGYSPDQAGELVVGPGVWWGNLQWPHTIEAIAGEELPPIYGRVYQEGVTDRPGAGPGLAAQLGYGPDGTDPRADDRWIWFDGRFNVDAGNDDEYCVGAGCCADCDPVPAPAPVAGSWDYGWRYTLDDGRTWVYADIDGSPNGFASLNAGQLEVLPAARVIPIGWAGNWGVHFSRDANCASAREAMEDPVDVDSWDRDRAACRQVIAEVYAAGHTDAEGSDPRLLQAEVVRRPVVNDVPGPEEALPLTFYGRVGNNHEYRWDLSHQELLAPPARRYQFYFRFSGDGGRTWHRIGQDDGPDAQRPRTLVYSF